MKSKIEIIFFYLFLLCFIIPIINSEENIEEIKLDSKKHKTVEITEKLSSRKFFVTGTIDLTKKYLLISLIDNSLNPSIFITKKKEIDLSKEEYDYILFPKENKLVLPSSYFNSDEIDGFYLNFKFENKYKKFSLKFEYLDVITLEIGEEFSFFARNENVENFKINILGDEIEELKLRTLSTVYGNIGFILSGGDENQLSMIVNYDKAPKVINNVFAYWTEYESGNYNIDINVSKNVKFHFKTQIFYTEDELSEEKKVEVNLYNQFFFVQNNKQECFNLVLSEEEKLTDLIIVGQEDFTVDIYESESKVAEYESLFKGNDKYAISENIKVNNSMTNFCITVNKQNSKDISLVQIYLFNKNNEYGIIPEPLISEISYNFILPSKNNSESDENVNIHTHLQFFEKASILGTNAVIKSISGKMKVYKDICSEYPKCSYNNSSRFRQEIYPLNGYYHTLLDSNSDSYLTSNRQNIFIVICEDEENECKYKVLFYGNQKKLYIKNGEEISKFLGPYTDIYGNKKQDAYFTYLHSTKNKIVINLAVYSGDAYLVQINDIKGCTYKEEHYGSDERRIISCDEDEMDDSFDLTGYLELKIEFSVRTGYNGAVYSLFVYEQMKDSEEIYIPLEMAKFDTIKNINKKFILMEKSNDDNKEIVSLINPVNCHINLTLDNNKYYSYENDYIQYKKNLERKSYYSINLDKYNNFNNIDQCLFYLSSYTHTCEDSFLIITENKPLKFRLNKNLDNIRLQYLYGMTHGYKKIYLKVNVVGNDALKIKIENINQENTYEYFVKDTKILTIMNGNNREVKGMSLNNLSRVKIYIQLYNNKKLEQKEALVDLKILTNLDTPNFLKRDEQLSDILINDDYKYFIALVNKGSSGTYYINVNNDKNGNVYARLLDSDHMKENGGWNNRFVLPTNNTDKNKLLPFDFENQKLIFNKGHTKYCNKYCYLLIGVNLDSYNNKIGINNNIITGFNSYLKLNDNKDDDQKEKKSVIKLTNNEHISSYVTDDEDEYFSYKLNNHNSKLNLNFECDNCMMTVAFNDTDFNSKNAKTFKSNGDKLEIHLGNDVNLTNTTAYFKITTLNNKTSSKDNKKNDIKYRYSLKFNSPNDIEDIPKYNYIDDSIPETVEFNSKTPYYDYVIKLDSYNSDKDINLFAVQNTDSDDNNNINRNIKDDIEIYANILNDDETISIDSWPNKTNHDFPINITKSSNFLNINKKDIKKGKNDNDDKIMLVRIYGKVNDKNNKFDLFTNYDNINDNFEIEEKKELVIPGKYQLFTVNNSDSNSSFKIDLPSNLDKNKDYIYKIQKLDGNGRIIYGDDTYEINDKYDSISFPINKFDNKIEIKSDNLNKNSNITSEGSFTFQIKFEEKNKFNSLDKIKIGGSKYFSNKDDTEDIEYFIPLENINNDLPININFDTLHSNQPDEYKNQIRNNTETFDINGYLITEDELNDIKDGNVSFLDTKKDFKYNGNYYLENKHGFLNIKKDDIDKHKKDNKSKKTYVYFKMKKSKINDNNYDKIKGNINIYPSNNVVAPLPENDYHYNSLDCSKKNAHIYKLGDMLKNKNANVSSNTHNMSIDFISPIEGLKVKIVKDINSTKEDEEYFGITKNKDNNGKDTITISKNIDDAYLLVETPDKLLDKSSDYSTNVDYMFKYNYVNKNKDKDKDKNKKPEIKYNNTLSYNKMGSTDLKTNITLNKIKDAKTNKAIPSNYYIRIYKNNKKKQSKNKNNFYPKKNISLINNNNENDIYAIYKIDSNHSLLKNDSEDSFTVPIEIDTDEPVFVDVLAEDEENKEIYGYSKGFPNSEIDSDMIDNEESKDKGKDEDKKEGGDKSEETSKKLKDFGIIKIILICICALLLLILLLICCIKVCSCSCCSKREKTQKLIEEPSPILPGIKDITFHTNSDDNDNNFTVSSLN